MYDILGNGDKRTLYDEGGLELVKEVEKQSAGQGGGRLPKGPSKNGEEGMPVHNFPSDRGVMCIKLDIQMPTTLSSDVIAWLHQSFPES